jgi:hypothetical protein
MSAVPRIIHALSSSQPKYLLSLIASCFIDSSSESNVPSPIVYIPILRRVFPEVIM